MVSYLLKRCLQWLFITALLIGTVIIICFYLLSLVHTIFIGAYFTTNFVVFFLIGFHLLAFKLIILLLLRRSTAVQISSSVRLMPQNWPSGRGVLPSPIAWSPDQHHAAMLADVSRHVLDRIEGRGLGFGQLVRTHKGKCLKCQSSADGLSDHSTLRAGGR